MKEKRVKLIALATGVLLGLFIGPSVSFAGMGGGGNLYDCDGAISGHTNTVHANMCDGGGGGMMGGGDTTGNGDPNCGSKHHRMEAGGDCVPCPNSSITEKSATRASKRNRSNASSSAKPPKPISQGAAKSGVKGNSHNASSNVTKSPLSVTGSN